MGFRDDARKATLESLRSQLRNEAGKADEQWQALVNLVNDLATELEDVKERLDRLENQNGQ